MAALIQRGDTEAWMNAITLALTYPEVRVAIPDLVAAAYSANGEALLDQLLAMDRQGGVVDLPDAVNIVTNLIADYGEEDEDTSAELRIHTQGGYAVFRFGDE